MVTAVAPHRHTSDESHHLLGYRGRCGAPHLFGAALRASRLDPGIRRSGAQTDGILYGLGQVRLLVELSNCFNGAPWW